MKMVCSEQSSLQGSNFPYVAWPMTHKSRISSTDLFQISSSIGSEDVMDKVGNTTKRRQG